MSEPCLEKFPCRLLYMKAENLIGKNGGIVHAR